MIDRDVGQILENTRIKNDFINSIVASDLLIHTFTERENTLTAQKDQLINEIKADIGSFNLDETTSIYEQKILSLLEELDIGLNAMPIAWQEISPHVLNLIDLTSRYKFQLTKAFKNMRAFHDQLGILKLSQKQVISETSKNQ
ncbi:MAG: hypothetical protein AB1Z29_09650 [Desulfobacterales bacterium]